MILQSLELVASIFLTGFVYGIVMAIGLIGAAAGIAVVAGVGYAIVMVIHFGIMLCAEWWGGIMPLLKLSPREIMRRVRGNQG